MSDPRDTYDWKKLRKGLVAKATHCAICGGALMHDARPRTKFSPSVDHIIPLDHGGAPYAFSNVRVVHYGCNASRGNGRPSRRKTRSARLLAPAPIARSAGAATGPQRLQHGLDRGPLRSPRQSSRERDGWPIFNWRRV